MIQCGKTRRQITIAIAGPETDVGGISALPALHPRPMSRTITDGVLGRVEGGRA
jgi:hypothetical protein